MRSKRERRRAKAGQPRTSTGHEGSSTGRDSLGFLGDSQRHAPQAAVAATAAATVCTASTDGDGFAGVNGAAVGTDPSTCVFGESSRAAHVAGDADADSMGVETAVEIAAEQAAPPLAALAPTPCASSRMEKAQGTPPPPATPQPDQRRGSGGGRAEGRAEGRAFQACLSLLVSSSTPADHAALARYVVALLDQRGAALGEGELASDLEEMLGGEAAGFARAFLQAVRA